LEKVRHSIITIEQAEQTLLAFIKKHCKPQEAPLCGNSVWVDRMFLQEFMPMLEKYLYYRTIDVSTIKLLAQSWFNINTSVMLNKQNKHQALDDIKESIAELNWYRKTIFKQD
jgi:oligoribonuclease